MDNDIIKKKNELFKSIMSNPKLAKNFRDAMAAPIGSTKREQAKSMFSVMKKVKGFQNDGQGGIFDNISNLFGGSSQSTQSVPQTNYGNMVIFPAAPKLKTLDVSNNTKVRDDIDFSKLGLTLNQTPSTAGLTGAGLSNTKNLFNNSSNNNIINGVVVPKAEQTLNTDPNQLLYTPSAKVITPTNPAIKDMGLNLHEAPVVTKASGLTGGATVTIPGLSMSDKLMQEYYASHPKTPETPVKPVETVPEVKTQDKPVVPLTFDTTKTGTSGTEYGSAAKTIATMMGGADLTTPLSAAGQAGLVELREYLKKNEGKHSQDGITIMNNPGHIKYAGLPGQIDSGVKAADGGTFASYATPEAGDAAIDSIIKNAAAGKSSSYGQNPTLGSFIDTYTNTKAGSTAGTTGSSSGSLTYGDAQKYVDQGLGSYAFGADLAKSVFGGKDLNQAIATLDEQLKVKYNLEPLEIQLSNLKAKSENFIPTLTSYIQGKDEYSKAIDKMIEQGEDQLLTTNMADPFTANQYNNYMNYLYTLKSRQDGRYTNYLNSAIADYNADVNKLQANYDNLHADYLSELETRGTIAKDTYNDLMTRGQALYQELADAPTKALNNMILQQQLVSTYGSLVGIGGEQSVANPKYWTDLKSYTDQISVQNGTTDPKTGSLDFTKVGPEGLISLYAQNHIQGGDQRAMTEAIRVCLAKTLETSGGDPKVVSKVKGLIDELRSSGYDEAATWADSLSSSIQPSTKNTLSKFIETKMKDVESAVHDLVKGGSGFLWTGLGARKAGIKDKEAWKKDHAALGDDFLEQLYNTININTQPGTPYAEDPSTIISQIFVGATDKDKADNLANIMAISG